MVSVTRVAGRSNNGFTLIELLLVLVILAALTALVMPRFSGRTRQARITTTRIDIFVNIPTALDLYEMDTGQYPTTEQGLDALIKEPRINPIPVEWNGPYLKRPVLPKDPWGNAYRYRNPPAKRGVDYELFSMGPDGIEHSNDDIGNWME